MRNASDYLADLGDSREFWIDGERIDDVRTHPATAGVATSVASLFQYSSDPANGMQSCIDGDPVNIVHIAPRSREESDRRRSAIESWSTLSFGFLGRSPDHVAGLFAGFAAGAAIFDCDTHDFSENLRRYQRYIAERDLYLTYAIVPPQSNPDEELDRPRQVEIVSESSEGIIVNGAQMLATGACVADELFVSSIRPLSTGEEASAVSFALPIATPGLRFILRPSYASAATPFDYPLSSRFDETDAIVVFDHVHVPWDRVFVHRDRAKCRSQFFDTPAHALANIQSLIRLSVKLRFVAAVARRIADINGRTTNERTMCTVSDIAALATVVEALVEAAHSTAEPDKFGVVRPTARFLYAGMGLQAELYPRAVSLLRELAGGGVLQVPASQRDLDVPEVMSGLDLAMNSPSSTTSERIKLFKLAWDMVGSEFAGRHVQYETFYSGNANVVKGYNYRSFPFSDAIASLDGFLSSYTPGHRS